MTTLRDAVMAVVQDYKDDVFTDIDCTKASKLRIEDVGKESVQYGEGKISVSATRDGELKIVVTPRETSPISADIDALETAINPIFSDTVTLQQDASIFTHSEDITELSLY